MQTIKSLKIIASAIVVYAFFSFTPFTAQNYEGLSLLEGHPIKTYYSDGSKEWAEVTAKRCENAVSFYASRFGFKPELTVLVLSKADWSKHTRFPVYGMPHYDDSNRLIVASEDNEFWKSFIPPLETVSKELANKITVTYADQNGTISLRGFFDLLALHELGHAFHLQAGLTMQRKWLSELFVNIFLHTYIAEEEPELLPALTVFPQMVVSSTDRKELHYRTLHELETNYDKIGQQFPRNYGWYQSRWHIAAGTIYDEAKTSAVTRLWFILKNSNEILDDLSLAALLSDKVHQSVADVPLKWDE